MRKGVLVVNYEGRRYGRLVVLHHVAIHNRKAIFRCRCDCGNEKDLRAGDLRSGSTKSCGCLNRERLALGNPTHGHCHTMTYKSWVNMHQRCRRKVRGYTERGISICKEWASYEQFLQDMGERPSSKHSIDRINNDLSYEPANCRWATAGQQMRNTRVTKISESGVLEVREMRAAGLSLGCIGKRFNTDAGTVKKALECQLT